MGRVLGLNPGMMTGPGTNTYLVGARDPILIDTGAGVAEYVPLFDATTWRVAAGRGPSRILLTHRHRDHLGGVDHLRERYPGPGRGQDDLEGRGAARGRRRTSGTARR